MKERLSSTLFRTFVLLAVFYSMVKGDTVFSNITGTGSVSFSGGLKVCAAPDLNCPGPSPNYLLAAAAFTPMATYIMTDAQVLVAAGEVMPLQHNQFSVILYSDSNGMPGSLISQIGSGLAATTGFPGSIVTANAMSTPITLTAGTKYWLVLAPGFPVRPGFAAEFIYWADGGSPGVPIASFQLERNPQWLPGTGSLQFQIDGVPVSQSYVDIVPSGVTSYIVPLGINTAGAITGWFEDDNPTLDQFNRFGFLRGPGGTITIFDLSTLSGDCDCTRATYPRSINDAGAITGSYNYASLSLGQTNFRGFVRDPYGNVTSFDPTGSIDTEPTSINARGVIAGYYNEANSVVHGFVRYDNGTVIGFDPPRSTSTRASSINAKGEITGNYQDANGDTHGFLRHSPGTIVVFDVPGSTSTTAVSINAAGAITGNYTGADGRYRGFVRDPQGSFTSFDPGFNTFPVSINDEGVITGEYSDSNSSGGFVNTFGFIRSPQGTITSFDPIDTEPTLCAPVQGHPQVFPTSINQAGVITGYCFSSPFQAWVRYP